jgi:hypothetical protein
MKSRLVKGLTITTLLLAVGIQCDRALAAKSKAQYNVTELGTLPGGNASYANAVNVAKIDMPHLRELIETLIPAKLPVFHISLPLSTMSAPTLHILFFTPTEQSSISVHSAGLPGVLGLSITPDKSSAVPI